MAGALFAAHLSGWAYRNVDDHMGRARRDLLGQDRGNELAFGIDVQLALDAHELVVSGRSEEHTSELQSLMRISYAVFCLKKKNNTIQHQCSQRNTNETE